MISLIMGGSGSGKSGYAEMVAGAGPEPRRYIATMVPWDEEGKRRVEKHRAMRAGKGFETVEQYTGVDQLAQEPVGTILLECVSNLLANELYRPENEGKGEALAEMVIDEILALEKACRQLVIVTNNVFDDGEDYDPETVRYMKLLAAVNRRLAAAAHSVTEVVCGIALTVK